MEELLKEIKELSKKVKDYHCEDRMCFNCPLFKKIDHENTICGSLTRINHYFNSFDKEEV